MDPIAERTLVCLYPDGASVPVQLLIGQPRPHPKGDWCCEVSGEGMRLWTGTSTIVGIDSWQALLLSLRFLRAMLEAEVERGALLHGPDGITVISPEELFGETGQS
ncbi:DUF6968 family protein [Gemmata palustris]|uniref:DUF6968 family protein n=1 Tax=Gemmata palustris TaxID=2822762 RepID=UPI0036F20269